MKRDRRYWMRVTSLAATALLAGAFLAAAGVTLVPAAIYTRRLTHPGCGDTGITPADVGITPTQDIAYITSDGLRLRAWYLPPENEAGSPRSVIILLPGLGGGRDGMLREGEHEVAETCPHDQLARAGAPKALWIVPDAGHGEYLDVAPEAWEEHVVTFFEDAFSD